MTLELSLVKLQEIHENARKLSEKVQKEISGNQELQREIKVLELQYNTTIHNTLEQDRIRRARAYERLLGQRVFMAYS